MNVMKKGIALLAAMTLVACSSNNLPEQKDVILVTEGSGIDDKSFNASAWRGITGHFGDTPERPSLRGVRYEVLHSSTQDQILHNINIASDDAPRLIIGTGFTFLEPMSRAATAHPDQYYLLIDESNPTLNNMRGVIFKEHEGSFLVGAAAALQAIEDGVDNPRFGFIGGIPGDVIMRFQVGYVQGILSVLPNANIDIFYAQSWGAPEIGKSMAMNWFNNGTYAIFSAAGGTGSGAIAEAKEQRMAGRNVWAIGVDSDQFEDGLYSEAGESAVLTSMLKLVEKAVSDALDDLDNNRFSGGTVHYGLQENGVGFSVRNEKLSRTVIDQVEQLASEIVSGQRTVYGDANEAKSAGVVPSAMTFA